MSNFYDSYGGSSSSDGKKTLRNFLIVIVVIFLVIYFASSASNWITEEKAMERFIEITGTTNIEIIRHSNLNPIFGDAHDATFELKVDGKNVSARCTSGAFSEIVCRIYTEE